MTNTGMGGGEGSHGDHGSQGIAQGNVPQVFGEIWMFRGEPAGRWGMGWGIDGSAIGSVDCEYRATRCLQMDVSRDNGYGTPEAGGWVDGSPLRGGGGAVGMGKGGTPAEAGWEGEAWLINIERL